MRHWIVEQWNAHGVLYRHLAGLISQQRAILKRSHGIEPGLRRAVDEAAVDPGRHLVNLSKCAWDHVHLERIARVIVVHTCSRGAFGLCPVSRSYSAR